MNKEDRDVKLKRRVQEWKPGLLCCIVNPYGRCKQCGYSICRTCSSLGDSTYCAYIHNNTTTHTCVHKDAHSILVR